jgi:hypothetical protein
MTVVAVGFTFAAGLMIACGYTSNLHLVIAALESTWALIETMLAGRASFAKFASMPPFTLLPDALGAINVFDRDLILMIDTGSCIIVTVFVRLLMVLDISSYAAAKLDTEPEVSHASRLPGFDSVLECGSID